MKKNKFLLLSLGTFTTLAPLSAVIACGTEKSNFERDLQELKDRIKELEEKEKNNEEWRLRIIETIEKLILEIDLNDKVIKNKLEDIFKDIKMLKEFKEEVTKKIAEIFEKINKGDGDLKEKIEKLTSQINERINLLNDWINSKVKEMFENIDNNKEGLTNKIKDLNKNIKEEIENNYDFILSLLIDGLAQDFNFVFEFIMSVWNDLQEKIKNLEDQKKEL